MDRKESYRTVWNHPAYNQAMTQALGGETVPIELVEQESAKRAERLLSHVEEYDSKLAQLVSEPATMIGELEDTRIARDAYVQAIRDAFPKYAERFGLDKYSGL